MQNRDGTVGLTCVPETGRRERAPDAMTDSGVTPIGRALARWWVRRFDRQQRRYGPTPDDLDPILRALLPTDDQMGRVRVVDLGCGPGSLGRQMLGIAPDAEVVGVDRDPLLVALGRALGGIRVLQDDLCGTRWSTALGFGTGSVDLVTASSAMHMLPVDDLRRVYQAAVRLLRPGGALVVADRMGAGSGRLDRVRASVTHESIRRQVRPTDDTWDGWWAAIRRESAFAALVDEHDRVSGPDADDPPALPWQTHARLLAAAGLPEVEPVWSRGQDVILVGVR